MRDWAGGGGGDCSGDRAGRGVRVCNGKRPEESFFIISFVSLAPAKSAEQEGLVGRTPKRRAVSGETTNIARAPSASDLAFLLCVRHIQRLGFLFPFSYNSRNDKWSNLYYKR